MYSKLVPFMVYNGQFLNRHQNRNQTLIYQPKFCNVDRVTHYKQMIHIHTNTAKAFCSKKNRKGYYCNTSDECVALWNEIIDHVHYLEQKNEMHYEEFSDIDTFLESL